MIRRVAVLLGGLSAEREVSLISGRACADALRAEGFDVQEIDVGHDLAARLAELKPDAAFNALHGRWGEDGCVQGLLEMLEIPYTHSGVLASALAMHKERAKAVFRAAGLPLANGLLADRRDAARNHLMRPPYVIKPVCEGSSVGVFVVREGANAPPAELGAEHWALGDEVMIEEYIPGRELTVAVMGYGLGARPLAVTEIVPRTDFYDYDAKYTAHGSEHVIPAKLSPKASAEAMRISLTAHVSLGCRGVSRTDLRFDEVTGRFAVLEVNTQPGMTPTSLVPEQAAYIGMDFGALVRWMLEDAACDR